MSYTTYEALGQAEDFVDDIYLISPVDNPTAAMSRTVQATGKLHEWQQDSLQAAKKNAAVEGADAGAGSYQPTVEKSNYCQIMEDVARVTGTLETVDKYGRASEMAWQLEKKYGEIANDEESAIVGDAGGTGRQTGSAGTSSTAREMASLHSQLDASVIVDATSYTTVAQLEAGLLEAHLATYSAGGNPSYLMTPPALAAHIANFALAAGRQRDIRNERMLVNVIDLYVSFYGEMDVVLDRNQDDCYLLLDFNYLATPVLRSTTDYPLARLGDAEQRQIIRESTFAVLNDKAHAMVDNIPASLT